MKNYAQARAQIFSQKWIILFLLFFFLFNQNFQGREKWIEFIWSVYETRNNNDTHKENERLKLLFFLFLFDLFDLLSICELVAVFFVCVVVGVVVLFLWVVDLFSVNSSRNFHSFLSSHIHHHFSTEKKNTFLNGGLFVETRRQRSREKLETSILRLR
jgi:hypothetical protein